MPAPTLVHLAETTRLVEAAVGTPAKKFRARLIGADIWGSSGYYSRDVLQEAANDKIFGESLPIFLDHPGADEQFDRPERSVRDLAGKLVSDAVLESDGLYADIEVYPHVAPLIEAMADDIGMSIRASGEVEQGEAEGREGTLIAKLTQAQSVDFVTKAGAQGKVVSLIESARTNARAIRHGIAEATVNDRREALSTLVRDEYGAEKTYVWLRDFDETTAWFEIESGDDTGVWQQTYATGDDDIPNALTGERVEVRVSTQYLPVTPAGQSPTEESEEDTMASTQIEEAELTGLREKAGRVPALEAERDTEKARADKAEADLAEARKTIAETDRDKRLDQIISESETQFTDLEKVGLKASAQVKEDGSLDEEAFTTAVAEAAAKVAEADGAGRPRGNGQRGSTTDSEVSEADLDELDDAIFGAVKEG